VPPLLQRRFRPLRPGARVTVKLALDPPTLQAIRRATGDTNQTLSAAVGDLLRAGAQRLREQDLPGRGEWSPERIRWQPQGEAVWTTVSTDRDIAELAAELARRWHSTKHFALHQLLRAGLGEP
jgi:hypothetical protein